MPTSGKYDFKGIKKYGAMGLSMALASTSFGGVLQVWGVKHVADLLLEWLANWLANKGLMVLNIGAIYVEGKWDQKEFDSSMDEAFKQIQSSEGKLTPEQQKAIDDKVIEAFRKFAVFTK